MVLELHADWGDMASMLPVPLLRYRKSHLPLQYTRRSVQGVRIANARWCVTIRGMM
jgi:hypothetical protein